MTRTRLRRRQFGRLSSTTLNRGRPGRPCAPPCRGWADGTGSDRGCRSLPAVPPNDSGCGGYHAADDRALARETEAGLGHPRRRGIPVDPASLAVRAGVSAAAVAPRGPSSRAGCRGRRRLGRSHLATLEAVPAPPPWAAAALRCRRRDGVDQSVPEPELACHVANRRI